MSKIHPARRLPFDDILTGMAIARGKGLVSRKDDPETGRAIFCYTQRCVFERAWDDFTLMARGLILHPGERRVVATPFPKFFNFGERDGTTRLVSLKFLRSWMVPWRLFIIMAADGALRPKALSIQVRRVGRRLESQNERLHTLCQGLPTLPRRSIQKTGLLCITLNPLSCSFPRISQMVTKPHMRRFVHCPQR